MAVQLSVKVDDRALMRELRRNGDKWAKQMEYATKDMKRSAKTIVKRATTSVYNIKAAEVTPGSGKAVGSCSLSGGITDLATVHRGFSEENGSWYTSPESLRNAWRPSCDATSRPA